MPTIKTHQRYTHDENKIDCYINGYDYSNDVDQSRLTTCDQQVYCHLSKDNFTFPPTAYDVQQFKNSMKQKGICQQLPPELNKCNTCPCENWRKKFYYDYYIKEKKLTDDDPCKEEACNYIMDRCRRLGTKTGFGFVHVSEFKNCIKDKGCGWETVRSKRGWTDNELIHGAPDDDGTYIFKGFGPKYETCAFGLHEESGNCATFWGTKGLGPPNKTAAWA